MVTPNQFSQSVVKGQIDLSANGSIFSCIVATGATLIPGQAVKLVDVVGKGIVVAPITDDTDPVFGIVSYSLKQKTFLALEQVEIASESAVAFLEASAAIARGAQVMPVVLGEKVDTAVAGKTILGMSLDKASNAGDLIRVLIANPVSKLIA